MIMPERPDIVVIVTDQERAPTPYETDEIAAWRTTHLPERGWFAENGTTLLHHYTGATACVPSRPTLFTGQYPDVHGLTQTDGLGKDADDSRMRWLVPGEVPTLGNWFRAGGYDTHYDGKWHISHADLIDPETRTPVATNTRTGEIIPDAVQAYLDADPLDDYGFSGWVGPEPHGSGLANSGLIRDPLIADRLVAWLDDRYARRRAGDVEALRPFLAVCCFVNPHDIVLWPGFVSNENPFGPSPSDPPPIPEPPTAHEDLSTKPAAQAAYRAAYASGYGPPAVITACYDDHAEAYRRTYYRCHAENDDPIGRVRRAVTAGSADAVIVRTADHGELLGAHGGLHQKWFNLYDECTRVPFQIVRVRDGRPVGDPGTEIDAVATSHVDVLPTLLGFAGIDAAVAAAELTATHSEVHLLPGHDLRDIVAGGSDARAERTVYLMSRDNILEGDTGLSAVARINGMTEAPDDFRIMVPADVGSSFEAIVTTLDGTLWKLARNHDDPATWTDPGRRHLASTGADGHRHRTEPIADQWELYDLSGDPVEADNRWDDPEVATTQAELVSRLDAERARCNPARNTPWPYASRRGADEVA